MWKKDDIPREELNFIAINTTRHQISIVVMNNEFLESEFKLNEIAKWKQTIFNFILSKTKS